MSIRDAFAPLSPDDIGTPAYVSVQASLFNRLRKQHGKNAGNLAWLLVRLAQPDHREHDEACAMIVARDSASLSALLSTVSTARDAARPAGARAMCEAIAEALVFARDGAKNREKATK